MFNSNTAFPGHKCQLNNLRSSSNLKPLLPTASWWDKLVYFMRKSIIVSRRHPVTIRNFKSQAAIARENGKLSKLPYILIHECSEFYAVWQIIILMTYAVYLLIVPYFIVFYRHTLRETNCKGAFIQVCASLILYLEIFVKWNTTYYDKKNEVFVLCRTQIRKMYLKTTFFSDIIAAFPSLLFVQLLTEGPQIASKTVRFTSLAVFFGCFLLNFLNVPKMLRFFRTISVHFDFSALTDLMIQICIILYYILHILTLAILITYEFLVHITYANKSVPTVENWDKMPSVVKYSATFLATLEGFLGTGFTNFNNYDVVQRYMGTLIVFCGWLSRAIIFTTMIKVIKSHSRPIAKFNEFLDQVKDYGNRFKLPNDLTGNILAYIEHRFQYNYFDEKAIYSTMSTRLKTEITMDQCYKLLEQVDLFRNLPVSAMKDIMRCLKSEIYLPGDILIKANTVGDKIFFLASGSVVVTAESGKKINLFEDGSYFGEIAVLIENKKRMASIVAKELCETYTLTRQDFYSVMSPHTEVFRQMQDLAWERMLDRKRRSDDYI